MRGFAKIWAFHLGYGSLLQGQEKVHGSPLSGKEDG